MHPMPTLVGSSFSALLADSARTLVLQSHLCGPLSALDMRLFGTRLVASTPGRPVEDLRGRGWRLPDESVQEPADFGHGQRQQLQEPIDAHAVGARSLLLRCPLFRCCSA